jgi:hypothetical protein
MAARAEVGSRHARQSVQAHAPGRVAGLHRGCAASPRHDSHHGHRNALRAGIGRVRTSVLASDADRLLRERMRPSQWRHTDRVDAMPGYQLRQSRSS